jgi:hypothetical protein
MEMEMRILAGDAASADELADALTVALGDGRVLLRRNRRSAEVRVRDSSDQTVIRVLDTIDRWLDHAGSRSAEMWLGERSYRLARSTPAALVQ